MLCERCKIREATIQYIEVVNGVRQEHSLCGQCAKETGFGQVSALFDGEFPFAKILSTLLGEEEVEEDQNYAQIVCLPGVRGEFPFRMSRLLRNVRSPDAGQHQAPAGK